MKLFGLALSILSLLVVVSCGGDLPSIADWEGTWRDVVGSVDEYTVEPTTRAECEEALGYLREVRPDLDPPPLPDLEPPVDSWFAEAEHAFFECEFNDLDTRRQVLQSLNTFEAEVDTVLSIEG